MSKPKDLLEAWRACHTPFADAQTERELQDLGRAYFAAEGAPSAGERCADVDVDDGPTDVMMDDQIREALRGG